MDYTFQKHSAAEAAGDSTICSLLARHGCALRDAAATIISEHAPDGSLVGVGGIAGDTVKCVAVADTHGACTERELLLPLMTELVATAWEAGEKNLLMYCSPDRTDSFSRCGFMTLAVVPGLACLMENNRQRLHDYRKMLAELRRPGERIAAISLEGAPFTLGHRFIVEKAASENDWVHVFMRRTAVSFFSPNDRLAMARHGVADFPNVTVHPMTVYSFSRGIFPACFIADEKSREKARTGIETQLFRKHLATALGITRLYTGAPSLTDEGGRYNTDLAAWLKAETVDAPALELVQIPRFAVHDETLSSSTVRAVMTTRSLEAVRGMIPESSYLYIRNALHCGSAM